MAIEAPQRRNGYTLVELVGVVALIAIVMNLSIGLLWAVCNWGQQSEGKVQQTIDCHRWENDLRAELSIAESAEISEDLLTVSTPEGTSEWRLTGDWCLMKKAMHPTRHERYKIGEYDRWQLSELPSSWKLWVETLEESTQQPLRIVVRRLPNSGESK